MSLQPVNAWESFRDEPTVQPLERIRTMEKNVNKRPETATFAAGCFWGIEAAFRQVKGVISTRAGYTGRNMAQPSHANARARTPQASQPGAGELSVEPLGGAQAVVPGRLFPVGSGWLALGAGPRRELWLG